MQEARGKFTVDIEPENSVVVDPLDGNLSLEGSAVLHFRRISPSASMGRISCKVSLFSVLIAPTTQKLFELNCFMTSKTM